MHRDVCVAEIRVRLLITAVVAAPRHLISAAIVAALMGACAPKASAYSVLAHEANIDAVWADGIRPLLVRRFPRSTEAALKEARAFAYGGAVIQDLGYYPFGSHFFSDLLHYVRSGDFVERLIAEARDLDEYAFALGALAHYAADNTGHPLAINRSVALMYPKLRAKYGDRVTYADSPATHVLVEFSFDVVQVAGGRYAPSAYHDFIGFKVAKDLLERAFEKTYGLEVHDVLLNEDLAISTYRHAISQLIPAVTRAAWRDKHEDILRVLPQSVEQTVVFRFSRQDYERAFGSDYRKPSIWMRFLTVVYKAVPKIGPLRPLKFGIPTREAEALFVDSLQQTRQQYRAALQSLAAGQLNLANTDFDTGRPSTSGEYPLADKTYAKLLEKLSEDHFEGTPEALRRNILAYYHALGTEPSATRDTKRNRIVRQNVASLAATAR